MMKKLVLLISLAVFMFFVTTSWAEPVKLKFGTVEPPMGWATVEVIKPFFERVEKDSEGTVKIELFSGGTLGRNPTQYAQLIENKVMDMGWVLNAYQPGRFNDDLVFNVPSITDNTLEGSIAMNRMLEKGLLDGYEKFVVLGIFCLNPSTIHTTFPVIKPDDLKGKKLRISGKVQHKAFEVLGGTPVGIPVTQAAEVISRGVVQGTILDWNGIMTFRIVDLTKYHLALPFGSSTLSLLCNKESYASLPEKAKAAFEKHRGEPFIRDFAVKMDLNEKQIMDSLIKDPAHHVHIPTPQERELWKTKMQPAVDAWVKERPKNASLLKAYMDETAKIRGEQ